MPTANTFNPSQSKVSFVQAQLIYSFDRITIKVWSVVFKKSSSSARKAVISHSGGGVLVLSTFFFFCPRISLSSGCSY
ncbi:uncharacterized protein BO66DRAFT_229276 [Aspergillus aculeatinus CBS 121060]|uniref:Uncharacterized protein n=1 Tax=Aspergillus aculeatinus CBS 121060 TaxID=1448322 RepID=A0ACD1GU05_9EURO|nr:hypothetical protein BO66DRAFT_229276 [Aspergillus aculeatinus CBS 121060]RAH64933.1 hypothetical protein BO66DRAFT_229276 [Aspergillus aculeatinus CBS 121060]